MKDFDYIIIGGGCAGLSLAHELNLYKKFENRTLAIIEPREEYKRDKTWSFWKVIDHNFDDCVKKSWNNFTINSKNETQHLQCNDFPYQSIDSGLFYSKIINELKKNKNISFFKNIKEININNSFIFNSVPTINKNMENLWQHFCGVEIQTKNDIFDNKIINLMDFNCDQRNSVHFFYTLPFEKNKALIETTWLSNMTDDSIMDYDEQIKEYIEQNLKIKNYDIIFKEQGAIPLFTPKNINEKNKINIGTAGGMTRLSTGYTFLNIQEHSKYIRENFDNLKKLKSFKIQSKYKFLDQVFLKVLERNPKIMPKIFCDMFKVKANTVIKFLSNKSNFIEDISIILKMPKSTFIKALFY